MESHQILGIITMVLLLILVAPRVLRFNMALGTTTRNIAIWVLVFTLLVWGYKTFVEEPRAVENTPVAPEDTI
ncbi:MAG: hypothetical protein AB7G06_08045 [Bdellovibrionales bacterium]